MTSQLSRLFVFPLSRERKNKETSVSLSRFPASCNYEIHHQSPRDQKAGRWTWTNASELGGFPVVHRPPSTLGRTPPMTVVWLHLTFPMFSPTRFKCQCCWHCLPIYLFTPSSSLPNWVVGTVLKYLRLFGGQQNVRQSAANFAGISLQNVSKEESPRFFRGVKGSFPIQLQLSCLK